MKADKLTAAQRERRVCAVCDGTGRKRNDVIGRTWLKCKSCDGTGGVWRKITPAGRAETAK